MTRLEHFCERLVLEIMEADMSGKSCRAVAERMVRELLMKEFHVHWSWLEEPAEPTEKP
jgi:hypothetical protein